MIGSPDCSACPFNQHNLPPPCEDGKGDAMHHGNAADGTGIDEFGLQYYIVFSYAATLGFYAPLQP